MFTGHDSCRGDEALTCADVHCPVVASDIQNNPFESCLQRFCMMKEVPSYSASLTCMYSFSAIEAAGAGPAAYADVAIGLLVHSKVIILQFIYHNCSFQFSH